MRAKDEVAGLGCLGKAEPDEPVFVLLARDAFAPKLVEAWCELVLDAYDGAPPTTHTQVKIQEARELAEQMLAWQTAHQRKIPD